METKGLVEIEGEIREQEMLLECVKSNINRLNSLKKSLTISSDCCKEPGEIGYRNRIVCSKCKCVVRVK